MDIAEVSGLISFVPGHDFIHLQDIHGHHVATGIRFGSDCVWGRLQLSKLLF